MKTKTPEDEAALIAELNITFPGANAKSLRGWASKENHIGVVVCGEAEIEEGYPIGLYFPRGDDPAYDGCTHSGFEAWCEARGWYVETYERGTLWVVPLPSQEELDKWQAMCEQSAKGRTPLAEGESPF